MDETAFSPSLSAAIKVAKGIARQDKHCTYGVSHLSLALFMEPTGLKEIVETLDKDVAYIVEWFDVRKEVYQSFEGVEKGMEPDDELLKVFDEAERSKIKLGADNIDAVCIFTAIVREGVVFSKQQLDLLGISEDEILEKYNVRSSLLYVEDEAQEVLDASILQFLLNLKTERIITEGELILGREKEVRTILENLERSERKGILLVGDSGIGKTATIKSFVKYLHDYDDEFIKETLIFSLNVPKILASSNTESEISKKLVDLFEKISKQKRQSILVIDDLQVLLEYAGGKSNVIANILNSQLNEGQLSFIFTITTDAYRKSIEKHPLQGKLEIVFLEEMEHLLMIECLGKHKERLEGFYAISIAEKTVEDSIFLSRRYFKEKKLPYVAIDLLDRTVASVRMSNVSSNKEIVDIKEGFDRKKNMKSSDVILVHKTIFRQVSAILIARLKNDYKLLENDSLEEQKRKVEELLQELFNISLEPIKEVTANELDAVVAEMTGIPIGKIQAGEKEKLLKIDEKLQERVKGQSSAIVTLSDAIIESRSGLSNPKQPIGSFFFLGPTGTGKTELAKSLAELLFDDEKSMIRFDMSEFKEEHSAALLYGAPPGYVGYEEGGMLVNKIRQKPYSVVLFDEIEKAHSSVYDVFLQIMDEGTIHDKLGRDGDFSNSIIIFTSNIGSEWIAGQIQEGRIPKSNELIEVMAKYFRPEFLGRLTEVVPFSPINETIAQDIFRLQFARLQSQLLLQKKISLELSDEALVYLAGKGFSSKYGARPIAGIIRTYIKKVISKFIVSEEVSEGQSIILNFKDNQLIWEQN